MFSVASRFVFSLVILGSGFAEKDISVSRTSQGGIFAPGDLIFEDEFNTLNTSVWSYEINMNGGYNDEFQIYHNYSENTYVRDGILYIRPSLTLDTVFGGDIEELYNGNLTLEGCTDIAGGEKCGRKAAYPYIHPPITSARLRTKGAFSFTYGRIELRAKMSSGDWSMPAIWLLPENNVYGNWPLSGEIDIIEIRGNRKIFDENGTINVGSEQTAATLNYGTSLDNVPWWTARGEINTPPDEGFDRDFHIYECIWTPTNMQFKVDGVESVNVVPPAGGFYELGQFTNDIPNPWINATNPLMAPYDENFHFILNVAAGGAYFTYIETQPPPPWGETAFLDFFNIRNEWLSTWIGEEHTMAIDYIRVYAI